MENEEKKATVHIGAVDTLLILWAIWKPDIVPYVFLGYGIFAILFILLAIFKASQEQ